MTDSVSQFLKWVTIADLKRPLSLITISPDDTVQHAIELLEAKQITSAAVYDPMGHQFLGFVDTLDLAVFLVRVFAENLQKHPHLYDPKELQLRFQMPVRVVINASKRDVFHPVDSKQDLHFLITNFLQYAVHRVPVMEAGKVVGIVSQSDVIRYVHKHASSLGDLLSKRIRDLKMDVGPVVSVTYDQTLMKAFTMLLINDITGLAVLDLKGRLVNNISASDLKGITTTSFYRLEMQMHEVFLFKGDKLPPVTCTAGNTVAEVISIIENTGVHRIFVVDEENRPTNVITLTDILRLFAQPLECL